MLEIKSVKKNKVIITFVAINYLLYEIYSILFYPFFNSNSVTSKIKRTLHDKFEFNK